MPCKIFFFFLVRSIYSILDISLLDFKLSTNDSGPTYSRTLYRLKALQANATQSTTWTSPEASPPRYCFPSRYLTLDLPFSSKFSRLVNLLKFSHHQNFSISIETLLSLFKQNTSPQFKISPCSLNLIILSQQFSNPSKAHFNSTLYSPIPQSKSKLADFCYGSSSSCWSERGVHCLLFELRRPLCCSSTANGGTARSGSAPIPDEDVRDGGRSEHRWDRVVERDQ